MDMPYSACWFVFAFAVVKVVEVVVEEVVVAVVVADMVDGEDSPGVVSVASSSSSSLLLLLAVVSSVGEDDDDEDMRGRGRCAGRRLRSCNAENAVVNVVGIPPLMAMRVVALPEFFFEGKTPFVFVEQVKPWTIVVVVVAAGRGEGGNAENNTTTITIITILLHDDDDDAKDLRDPANRDAQDDEEEAAAAADPSSVLLDPLEVTFDGWRRRMLAITIVFFTVSLWRVLRTGETCSSSTRRVCVCCDVAVECVLMDWSWYNDGMGCSFLLIITERG
jgi:hypothetical protein